MVAAAVDSRALLVEDLALLHSRSIMVVCCWLGVSWRCGGLLWAVLVEVESQLPLIIINYVTKSK
jgi:hypothetical protein